MSNPNFNITNTTGLKPMWPQGFLDIKLLLIIVFSLILTLSVFGNLMIVAIVKRNANTQMKTNHNYLLVSLSLSNLLISTSCAPVYIVSALYETPEWKVLGTAGLVLCKMGSFVADQAIAASFLTTIFISVDWFVSVFQPFKRHLNGLISRVGMILSWGVSTVFAGPILFTAHLQVDKSLPTKKIQICNKGMLSNKVWICTKIVLTGVMPLVFVVTLNTAVILKLWCHTVPGSTVPNWFRRATQRRANRKGYKLPLGVILLFYFCFLPYWIAFIGSFVFRDATLNKNFVFTAIATLLAYSNSAVTPWLIICLGTRYRKGFISVMKCLQCFHFDVRIQPTRAASRTNNVRAKAYSVTEDKLC